MMSEILESIFPGWGGGGMYVCTHCNACFHWASLNEANIGVLVCLSTDAQACERKATSGKEGSEHLRVNTCT